MEEWKKAASDRAVVAIGTRSAVFAPLNNIGLIIMDEEQEHTYKSEQSPRFHAREVAALRCKYHNALLLLGSATPSVESYCHANENRYGLVTLKNRYGNAVLPQVQTVDMCNELSVGNTGIISRLLANEISKTLQNKKQAILLLNRRGHNTYISCPACGHVFNCENCSISLTYHSANKKLMCHYCGTAHSLPEECPNCKNKKLRFSGVGTQRADEEIAAMFPDAKILRLDADTTMARDAFEKGLSAFAKGEYDIMLGTQMVAKGLDFPNVTLVGVLSADQSMHSDDFRALERTFSLLTQVIGRSGRGDEPGLAIVQTHEPENDIIELACNQDYDGFYSTEILTRKLMIYPPYCDIVMIGISAVGNEITRLAALKFFELIKKSLENQEDNIKMIILGPTAANVPRVNSKYRQRIILKTKNTPKFRDFLHNVILDFYSVIDKNVSVFVDINPESII
jgi:primosomal protein N' (replication factor Y)